FASLSSAFHSACGDFGAPAAMLKRPNNKAVAKPALRMSPPSLFCSAARILIGCRSPSENDLAHVERQALDLSHLRRSFKRGRVERALSHEFVQRPDRAFGRFRSADADGL